MSYLRFILTPLILTLAIAYLLPSAGVTLATGVVGVLAAVGLGIVLSAFYALYRQVEDWFVARFARDNIQAYNICQCSAVFSVVLTAGLLFGAQWLLPAYVELAGWGAAVVGGFWLAVIGMMLTPAPALVRSFRRPAAPKEAPKVEKEPAPGSDPQPPASGDTGEEGKQ